MRNLTYEQEVFSLVGIKKIDREMNKADFIEIRVKNHLIVHGFDENNAEIIEKVSVKQATRKLIAIDRIQSVSEKYLLTSYAFNRIIYWEYEESYTEILQKLIPHSSSESSS